MTKPKTPPKPKPPKRLSAKQLKEDIDFYLALKAMPPEKLGTLAPILEEANRILREDARPPERGCPRRGGPGRRQEKAAREPPIAMAEARIADILNSGPNDYLDDDELERADDTQADSRPPRLH